MTGLKHSWFSVPSTRKLKATCYTICILVAIISVVKAHNSHGISGEQAVADAEKLLYADNAQSCTADAHGPTGANSYNSIWFVGVLSSLVFAFVGVLPAFFIQSDADEEAFSKTGNFHLYVSLVDQSSFKIVSSELQVLQNASGLCRRKSALRSVPSLHS